MRNSGEKSVQRNLNDSLPRPLGHAATGHSKPHNYQTYNIFFIFLLCPTRCLKLLELYYSPIQRSLSDLTTDRYTELGCQENSDLKLQDVKPKTSDPLPPQNKSGKTQTPPPKKIWITQTSPPKKNSGKLRPPPRPPQKKILKNSDPHPSERTKKRHLKSEFGFFDFFD